MEVTRHDFSATRHFAATQPLNPFDTAPSAVDGEQQAIARWLQAALYHAPVNRRQLLIRLLRPQFALALLTPVICGVLLSWWTGAQIHLPTLILLLLGSSANILGFTLLHETHDYGQARRNNEFEFQQIVFATGYHLLTAGIVTIERIIWSAYGLLGAGFLCYLGLIAFWGWPLLFFYGMSLLLMFTFTAPPIRYGHRGWGLGEIGLMLGYSFFPMMGSYYITSHTLARLPALVSIPFGLMIVLLFANYNFIHYRRDWLMRKRTIAVNFGPPRALDINSLLTVLIYAILLCLVSLAYLPMVVLITLAALPLAIRIYGQLRREVLGLEESFLLYSATVTAMIWTALLFVLALVMNKLL